jgi:acyl-CoA reductase-like NAD-dependent aldehyde dehydrogenase
MKHSGFGRVGGSYAMEDYLETKYVSWRVQGAAGGEKVPKR